MWYAALPRSQWDGGGGLTDWVKSNWQEPFGDRRQEIVFIGAGMNREARTRELDACLLTEKEFGAGPKAWARYEDSFPDWE